jgi:hypothetical protein
VTGPAGVVRATYNDGKTSAAHTAQVQLHRDGLQVAVDHGDTAIWLFDDLGRMDGPESAGLRISCEGRPGERLTIHDSVDGAILLAAMPNLGWARGSKVANQRALKWIVGGFFSIAALGWIVLEGLPRAFTFMPMAWVAPIGESMRGQITTVLRSKMCDSPEIDQVLARLQGRLLAGIETSLAFDPSAVEMVLAKHTMPNAFAAPGGKIVAFNGLLPLLADDRQMGGDAFAGVLAHEIAHARLRHPTRALGRALGLNAVAQISGGVGVSQGLAVAQLAHTRSAEREADVLARQMLASAGIGDAGLTNFFLRMQEEFGGDGGFLSSHPASKERAAAGQGVVGPERAFTEAEWAALKAAC